MSSTLKYYKIIVLNKIIINMKGKLFLFIFIALFLNISYATNILFLSYDYGDANAFKE